MARYILRGPLSLARMRWDGGDAEADEPTPAERQAARRAWARMIKRVFEVDPLVCAKCGGAMKVIAVILDSKAIRKSLEHIERRDEGGARAPPGDPSTLQAAS